MNLLVSTNVYKPGQLARVIPHLHAFRGQIGVELFPMFDADCYEEELLHCLPEFEGIPVFMARTMKPSTAQPPAPRNMRTPWT